VEGGEGFGGVWRGGGRGGGVSVPAVTALRGWRWLCVACGGRG